MYSASPICLVASTVAHLPQVACSRLLAHTNVRTYAKIDGSPFGLILRRNAVGRLHHQHRGSGGSSGLCCCRRGVSGLLDCLSSAHRSSACRSYGGDQDTPACSSTDGDDGPHSNVQQQPWEPRAGREPSAGDSKVLETGLYVVATPIGNLEDITLRALRVLQSVNLILAEDTRHTRKMLHYYGIRTDTMSFHAHNEKGRESYIVQRLQDGEVMSSSRLGLNWLGYAACVPPSQYPLLPCTTI